MPADECLGEFTLGVVLSLLTVALPLVAFLAAFMPLAIAGISPRFSSLFFATSVIAGAVAMWVLIWMLRTLWPLRQFRRDDAPEELEPALLETLAALPEVDPGVDNGALNDLS